MSDLLQCGWNESVRLCHWINCHGTGPCSGIPASQYTRSRADEIARLQSALSEREATIAGLSEALKKHHDWHLQSGEIGLPDGNGGWIAMDNAAEYPDSPLCEQTLAALANAPARDKS